MFFLHSNLLSFPNKNDGCTSTWELRLFNIRKNDYVLHWKVVIKTNLMGSSEHMVALYGRNKKGCIERHGLECMYLMHDMYGLSMYDMYGLSMDLHPKELFK